MASSTPQLYCLNKNYSTWSLRGWVAMRALNIDFETVMLTVGGPGVPDMGTPAADALMMRAGPTGKTPALHVQKPGSSGEKHIIFESLAIMEYLAEDYPSLWPADRFERAYARSLAAEMATSFEALRNYSMNIRKTYPFDPELYNANVEKNILRLSSIWEELRSKAVAKDNDEGFLFGSFTALDAMYAPIMFRLRGFSLKDKLQGKLAAAYVDHMLNFEAMREWEESSSLETEWVKRNEVYN
ncbi:hypothetical protein BGZ99_005960 [Dissophora globulifera]|uniref:GST N-terminal domain-containing protein n=1 Tax=Dissophora globulifera TaxID=979702 RepID=A0A9P6RDB0_9FUNG|nr:hypothetical protein BGZ99_005960 [Dissophora globulifera]